MFRPITIGQTNFGKKTTISNNQQVNTETKSNKQPPNNTDVLAGIESPMNYNNTKNAFLAGAFMGLVLGTGGTYIYNDFQTKEMIKNLQEELTYDNNQKITLEDVNEDKVPDIILEDKNGNQTVFDFRNNNIYFKEDNELIEML